MSARALWIFGMVAAIFFVECLVVRPMAEWRFEQDILNSKVPYAKAFPNVKRPRIDPVISPQDPQDVQDVANLPLIRKWQVINKADPVGSSVAALALLTMGALLGALLGSIALRNVIRWSESVDRLSTTDKIAGFLGLLIGLVLSGVILPTVLGMLQIQSRWFIFLGWTVTTYLCIRAMMSMKEDLRAYFLPAIANHTEEEIAIQKPKILDTNVIIDGRVSDVCRAGFVEGQVIIPSFVLDELQHIADSSDSLRRARGRRGLDILNGMRKDLKLSIRQDGPVDAGNTDEVDSRLVKLAKEIDGCIVTNDFNLNKVAELQGVPVLNINELANALKPVVLPGEEMTVTIIKEGKEVNQGIAYLDDGTMVVVEGARRHIGETLDVIVTSVLQTVAGKMIFANLKPMQEEEDELIDRNVRNYSGFRPRKKVR